MESDKIIESILNDFNSFNIDDIPNIDLYMDQVTTYLNNKFEGSKRNDDDKLLTKTMINNYAKSRLLPPPEKKKYSKADLRLMASIINCEAGSEPYQGKVAVGIVVMNRVSSKSFPNSIKGVIYQKGQFSPVRNGSLKKRLKQYDAKRTGSKQWKSCISAAKRVLQGQKTILYRGKTKNMKSFHFFSVYLAGARMKLGGHKFK